MKISVIAVDNNITLFYKGETIVISKEKNPELFEDLIEKIIAGDVDYLAENFVSIKEEIEGATDGVFSIENQRIVLKGSKIAVPEVIVKKLRELEKNFFETSSYFIGVHINIGVLIH